MGARRKKRREARRLAQDVWLVTLYLCKQSRVTSLHFSKDEPCQHPVKISCVNHPTYAAIAKYNRACKTLQQYILKSTSDSAYHNYVEDFEGPVKPFFHYFINVICPSQYVSISL